MAGYSVYSNGTSSTEGMIASTHQGLDRCASLLRALLSPTKLQGCHKFPGSSKYALPSIKIPSVGYHQMKMTAKKVGTTAAPVTKGVQKPRDNVRNCSANRRNVNKKKTTESTVTAAMKKNEPQGNNGRLEWIAKDTNRRRRKLSRPIPVAISTPQNDSFKEEPKPASDYQQQSLPVGGIYPISNHPFVAPAAIPSMFTNEQCHSYPWPPFMCLPPYYQIVDSRQNFLQKTDNRAHQLAAAESDIAELKKQLKESQKALHEAQDQVAKCEDEKIQIQRQHTIKLEAIQEVYKHEREKLTLQISQLEHNLKNIELQWKEKYHKEVELELQEMRDDNQMLKLSVAEKETELLQSQDTLLGIRQCLAHMLLDLEPYDDRNWSLLPQKDVVKIQTIVNTGHCIEDEKTTSGVSSAASSITDTPTQYSLEEATTNTLTQSCTGWTTSSEIDFRRDLAALDADIARLQIHFNIASQ